MNIRECQKMVHQLAVSKGWHEKKLVDDGELDVSGIAEKLLMIHSEISEATEELRTADDRIENLGIKYRAHSGKPEGFSVELADAAIRIMDLCEDLGIDLQHYILLKHEYNKTRAHRHGGKAL